MASVIVLISDCNWWCKTTRNAIGVGNQLSCAYAVRADYGAGEYDSARLLLVVSIATFSMVAVPLMTKPELTNVWRNVYVNAPRRGFGTGRALCWRVGIREVAPTEVTAYFMGCAGVFGSLPSDRHRFPADRQPARDGVPPKRNLN